MLTDRQLHAIKHLFFPRWAYKKDKCQPKVIIWTNLDGLEFLMQYITRFSLEALLVLEKKIFYVFFTI